MGSGERSNHVDGDRMPGVRGNIVWDQGGMSCCSINLHPLAFLASLDVGGNLCMHMGPPEVPSNGFLTSIGTGMSCYCCIVVLSDDLGTKSSVCRDVD